MRPLDTFIQKIVQKPIFHKEFFAKMRSFKELEYVDVEDLHSLRLLGLPITKYNNYAFTLESVTMPIPKAKFCIVDIEANGSKPSLNQIIEIGAVMIENGEEIGRFSSLVKTDILPDSIVYNNVDASLNCLIVWQVMGFSILAGVLWGMWELYFETKEKLILIILIVIYLVTLPTALDLLGSCYEDSGSGGRFESSYVYDGD